MLHFTAGTFSIKYNRELCLLFGYVANSSTQNLDKLSTLHHLQMSFLSSKEASCLQYLHPDHEAVSSAQINQSTVADENHMPVRHHFLTRDSDLIVIICTFSAHLTKVQNKDIKSISNGYFSTLSLSLF